MDSPSETTLESHMNEADSEDRSSALERNNLILVVLGTLATLFFRNWTLTWSFFAGGALTVFNLRLLRLVVRGLTSQKPTSRKKLVVQVVLKFVGGLGALAVLMLVFHPQPLAFLLGLSTLLVAVVFEGILGFIK